MRSQFSIFFAGDFSPCRRYHSIVLKKGSKIFHDLRKDIIESDLSFFNLETPLCIDGIPIEKSGGNLNAHPDCIRAVKEAGFKVVGLANNHIMDFGIKGLEKTIDTCLSSGLTICGVGKNLDKAQSIPVIEKSGLKVAFIAVAEREFSIAGEDKPGVAPLDPIDNTIQIEAARNKADLVFVSIHGGNEYFPLPRPGLRKLCKYYIDRGADAVICHHSHVPGAYEFYRGKPIVYSLGNLIFDKKKPPAGWDEGYSVRLDYNISDKKLSELKIFPYTQTVEQGGLHKLSKVDEKVFFNKLEDYKKILNDKKLYKQAWDDFCHNEKNTILLNKYFPVGHFRGMRRFGKIINPEIFLIPTNKNRSVKLNLIRCESHLELLQNVLEKGAVD